MPTLLYVDGFQIKIYLNDHPPAHVHVYKAGLEARITLEQVQVVSHTGFNQRDLRQIVNLVMQYREDLLARWDAYHPSR